VTSGTGLNPNADAGMRQLTTGRNADAGLTLLRIPEFIHMIFQYHIARITPSEAVYGRAGCITFHYPQFGVGRALGIPITSTNNSIFKCRTVRHPVSPVPD
jgi:hypothetical protein